MAITTLANVKTILGITDGSKDALITLLIPMIESDYLNIRNKPYDTEVLGEIIGYGDDVKTEFNLSHPPIIAGSYVIYIGGSVVTAYTLNIATGVITFTLAPGESEKITADYTSQNIIYPEGSELTAIQMIGYRLTLADNTSSKEIKTEHIGDYSVTYESSESAAGSIIGNYPASITGGIKRYTQFV